MHQPTLMDLRKHERIKFELRLAGSSLADISRELGISQAAVSTVSMGWRRSRKIQSAIAVRLGQEPEQLWPKRYRKKESSK
ncbi:helix-turn-helix domain-containing protein [Phaeobacter inhibens]|uniref:helix-turn-helix domain-containing protein n=1 Tax=Phaeobacter inhibens TaxID=221822 RepID=UPI0021F98921|nr:helix-turn-helix domain-containing protein [Phaeobacter inhibens]